MAKTMPPLDVPSSLVRAIAVTSTARETLGLHQGVLAGGGVEDEEDLVRRVRARRSITRRIFEAPP